MSSQVPGMAAGLAFAQMLIASACREMNEAGEQVMVLAEVPQQLPHVRQLLQQALQQAEAAAAGAAAAERRTATAAAAAQPPAPAPPPAASAQAGAGGSGSNVDATSLARALAAALGSGSGGGSGTGPPATGGAVATEARPAGQPGTLRVTPKGLAKVLAQAMQASSIGVPPPAPPQEQQEQPPPGPAEQ